ncbi:MAG: hypothetical protein PHP25_01520 [Candidatus Moranbacteria bacterium]|nr:hypothetical protein [Candidatus Moranbacteria bacterium]
MVSYAPKRGRTVGDVRAELAGIFTALPINRAKATIVQEKKEGDIIVTERVLVPDNFVVTKPGEVIYFS